MFQLDITLAVLIIREYIMKELEIWYMYVYPFHHAHCTCMFQLYITLTVLIIRGRRVTNMYVSIVYYFNCTDN